MVGAPGNAPSPTELLPVALAVPASAGPVTITDTTSGGTGTIDALLLIPVISTLTLTGNGHTVELLNIVGSEARPIAVHLAGAGQWTARATSEMTGSPKVTTAGTHGVLDVKIEADQGKIAVIYTK